MPEGSSELGDQQLQPWEKGLVDPPLATPRETDVLRLLADDHTHEQIASELEIALSTVQSHVKNLHLTSGTHTPNGLIAWAFRKELVE